MIRPNKKTKMMRSFFRILTIPLFPEKRKGTSLLLPFRFFIIQGILYKHESIRFPFIVSENNLPSQGHLIVNQH